MAERVRLPNRRVSELVDFEHGGRKWTLTVGRFADGRVGEVFLDTPKASAIGEIAADAAIAASVAFQHGAPLETVRHALADRRSLLPDDTLVFPDSINNRGEVVGWSCGPSEVATPFPCDPFYWRMGMKQPIDLNQLTQSPHLGICCASDINDSGEIVVAVFDPSYNGGDIRAAVLVPQQGGPPTAENLPGTEPRGRPAVRVAERQSATPQLALARLEDCTLIYYTARLLRLRKTSRTPALRGGDHFRARNRMAALARTPVLPEAPLLGRFPPDCDARGRHPQ